MVELAYIRNLLYKKIFTYEAEEFLKKIIESSEVNLSPFSGLIKLCILNAISDIKDHEFESAGNEINFIHNLPLSENNIDDWDEHHFYTCEILGYIELVKMNKRIRDYLLEICKAQDKIRNSGIVPKRPLKDNV